MVTAGRLTVLFDGGCSFCRRWAQRLQRLARPGWVELVNVRQPGALEHCPGLSPQDCLQALHVITADGRAFRGAEAIVRVVMTRPVPGWLAALYFLPPLRWITDAVYRWIARHRFEIP